MQNAHYVSKVQQTSTCAEAHQQLLQRNNKRFRHPHLAIFLCVRCCYVFGGMVGWVDGVRVY